MATIDDYWILLPSANDTIIYTELQTASVQNKTAHRFSSSETKKKTLDFLCRCLRSAPVTTCKLLKLLPPSICDAIYGSVLLDLLNGIDSADKCNNQFLAILLNGQWSSELIGRFKSEIFLKLVNHLVETNSDIDRHFKLCLAFVDDDKLREQFFFVDDRLCDDDDAVVADDLKSKRRFFTLTVVRRKHFIEKLIQLNDVTRSMLTNDVLRETLYAVDVLHNPPMDSRHKDIFACFNNSPITNNCLRRNLFNELQRLYNLNESFALHIPTVQLTSSYGSTFNVIDILCEHVNLSNDDSDTVVRTMLQTNRKYNQRFDLHGDGETVSHRTELELYDEFMVVKLLLDVIMDNQQVTVLKDSSIAKLNKVNVLLKSVQSIERLHTLLEIVFSLIFIRWDNVIHSGDSIEDSDRIVDVESGSESCKSRKDSNRPEKTAFICSAVVLENILDLLKTAVVALDALHPPNALLANDNTKSFQRLHNNIMDAHWRMTLFHANFNTRTTITDCSRSTTFVGDDIRKYFIKHKSQARDNSSNVGGSSDDDNNGNNSQPNTASVYRRKPRKRNPLRKSTDDKNLVISNSTEQEQKSDGLYRSVSGSERRCPVSRLLGSSEHLATVCLNNGNFEATREIVEANNLGNSVPAKELNFMANYNQTKEKLRSVCEKCYILDTTTTTSDLNASSTVERLKYIATIGFEASQAQSIITTFAADNEYYLSTDDSRTMIRKLCRQYPFLEMFNATALQASIAVDLIISLSNSYEMFFNIFNMLTKLWTDPSWLDNRNFTIGYLKFTKNICECLQLYKTIAMVQFGVRELICNECYVLVPEELKAKLEKERVMQSVQSLTMNDIDTVAKWKALLKPMDSIRGEVNYFGRSYHFIVNLMKLLALRGTTNANPMDVMEMDLCEVIGDIVFVNERLPGDIVEIVDNLNVNFVYVLCRNMMPVIPCRDPNDQAVTDSLIENLRNDNQTNSKQPSSPLTEKRLYRLSTAVLNFLKKNNSLIAYLLQQEYNNCEIDGVVIDPQKPYVKNVMALDDVKSVATMHGDSLLLSALNYDTFDTRKLGRYLDEDKENCRNAIRIIQSSSEQSLRIKGDRLKTLHDLLIGTQLTNNNSSSKNNINCNWIEQINDIRVKSEHLLDNILSIESSDMVKRLIRSILLHKNVSQLDESYKLKLHEWLQNIQIYDTITDRMFCANWIEAREMSHNSSESILKCLLNAGEFDLCLTWLKMHPLAECPTKFTAFANIFREEVLATTTLNRMLFKIIETLPPATVLQFYDTLLTELRSLELLEYVTDFLIANGVQPSIYQRHRISLNIFSQMTEDEQDANWMLFKTPLMIIEQYLMNSRHDAMSTILNRIQPILSNESCKYCNARSSSSYDAKSSSDPDFKISLTENDFDHRDHSLSRHCIDSLLQVYASKALDFRVSETHSHSSNELLTHSMASLDSLCGSFVMPKVAPDRLHWIKDEDASHCMCCRRSAFTMFCRRHHCRRCGRVVCHACSTKRIEIPELYCDVQVRSCDDCYRQIQSANQRKSSNVSSTTSGPVNGKINDEVTGATTIVWQFSGNKKHDNLLREEFCFEYAPSVSLCLSILQFYSSDGDCVKFLLHHCQKFESLLRPIQSGYPNPEIDYALVTRMMHCLALAAKVRGGPPECDTIRDHGEIIQSIVHHGCESLMPMEPPNSSSFRKLRDSLVLAEKWSLALELSLKCGFATTGVLAAWGISCLRAGCFETAREKFTNCLTKTGTDDEASRLTDLLLQESTEESATEWMDIPIIKRSAKSPPLLEEIISILDATCRIHHQPEVIARANIIKDSNTSLASTLSNRREKIPLHEPALNVMHTLSSLKTITRGIYDGRRNGKTSKRVDTESTTGMKKLIRSSRFYDECLYYLIRYGSHNSILTFLIKNDQLGIALKYFLYQTVDADSFINVIFLPFLRSGRVDVLINRLIAMDDTLLVWKEVIIKTCCYLEHKSLLNSLYHLQILLKDPIRASMTCVKFYSMNCSTYLELQNNSFHLINAQKHLQTELEMCQWEEIPSVSTSANTIEDSQSILMKMDSRTLNSHINTIWRQIEVTKFLSKCEQNGCDTVALLMKITAEFSKIPTLFGTLQEKIQLAVLTIIASGNINAGFGLAFRIIQDFNLKPIKVYGITAKYLSGHNRLDDVEKLIENINSNSDSDSALCDEIISLSIHTAIASSSPLNAPVKQIIGQSIESLLRYVTDIGIKISCHIAGGQLKSAYLLAVQYNRFNDVRKVLRKAEQTNQQYIKKLCEKKLNAH